MSVYQLKTFGDLITAIREECGIQSTDTTSINRIKRALNIVYQEVVSKKSWGWLTGELEIQVPAFVSAGTVSVTTGSSSITFTTAPGPSKVGHYFALDGFNEIFTIESHTAGSTSAKLSTEWTGTTQTGASYKVWTDKLPLPTNCKDVIMVWHDHHQNALEDLGRQEFRRIKAQSPRTEGKPTRYFVGDFKDPQQTSTVASLPAVTTRASAGTVKTIVFASALPAAITAKIAAGESVNWRVSGAGHPAYNGDVLVSTVSTTSVTNDTITYISPIEHQESAVADATMSFSNIDTNAEEARYREMFVYPALNSARLNLHVDYEKEALPLENDSDEPIIPYNDRVVLFYGALSKTWSRLRNPEESKDAYALYSDKLGQMSGKLQETLDKPKLMPSRSYLAAKRSTTQGQLNSGVPSQGGGGSSGAVVTGTPNSVATFNSAGEIVGSATVSTTELGYLDGVSSAIQTQLDTLTTADATEAAARAAADSSEAATRASADTTHAALTGTSAHGAASTNTASAIVARDGSGNFSAGTITANLTGTASNATLAATVTTNANLTGPITSVGNATSIASQTGTGTKFVVDTSPTLVTPNIGAATGTSLSVSGQLTSTVATGTAPLVVSSTTQVANLKAASAGNADTVTTNANLTGPITSVGNATAIASQTGTGSKFVVDTSPTLVTPNIGAATGTSLSVSGQLTSTVATGTAPLVVSSTTTVANLKAATAGNADTVTTNANMTGDVTSVGNATTYSGTVPLNKGGTGTAAASANAAFNALAPTTTKGDLIGFSTVNARIAVGTDGDVLTADSASTPGVKWATPTSAPTSSQDLQNLGLATSVSGNALTIALKQADGSTNPGAGSSAVKIGFRSSTATTGGYSQVSATGAVSLVISSGSTLGQTSAIPDKIYIYAINNAGTIELAACTGMGLDEGALWSTTAEGGAGAADSRSVLYSTTARANVAVRLIGVLLNTQTTAGTWASAGTRLSVAPFGNSVTTPTIQRFTTAGASGTYTTPTVPSPLYLKVTLVGGGGGGGGSGAGGGTGGTGGTSTFGSSLLTAAGGVGGALNSTAGAGGAATVAAPAVTVVAVSGGDGANLGSAASANNGGGMGGVSLFGGAGAGGYGNNAGSAGKANTGAGGGGAGGTSTVSGAGGGGAGAGITAIIYAPAATYAYGVGAKGTAGTAGTSGNAGGAGSEGVIIVEEYYQ